MAKLADIARAAGVSSAVVSRVINEDRTLRVSEATRARVQKAIKDLDYAPNIAAQTLRSAKSGLVAVILHDVTNPVYAEILRGAQASAAQNGKALLVFDSATGAESANRLAAMIGGGALDGLVIQGAGEVSDLVLARAATRKIPTILLQADLDIEACLISLPDEAAAGIATRHLLDHGHRRIGCLATVEGMRFTDSRLAGYRNALSDAGIDPKGSPVIFSAPEIDAGAEACAALLRKEPDLTAIVCFNVLSAIGAMKSLGDAGRRIPDDVSIVAVHDVPFADVLTAPLTTVAMPLFEMGEKAIQLVSDGVPDTQLLAVDSPPPTLIRRKSVAKPNR